MVTVNKPSRLVLLQSNCNSTSRLDWVNYLEMLQLLEDCARRGIIRVDSQRDTNLGVCLVVAIHFRQGGGEVRVIFRIAGGNSNGRFELRDGLRKLLEIAVNAA